MSDENLFEGHPFIPEPEQPEFTKERVVANMRERLERIVEETDDEFYRKSAQYLLDNIFDKPPEEYTRTEILLMHRHGELIARRNDLESDLEGLREKYGEDDYF